MNPRATLAGAVARFLDTSWVLAAGVAGSAGILTACRTVDPGIVLAAFMASASVGAAFVIPWIPTVPWRSKWLLIGGPGAGAVTVVILGLVQLIGVAAIAVVVLLVVSAPAVRAAVAPRLVKRPHTDVPHRPAPAMVELPGERHDPVRLQLDEAFVIPDVMTDEDLCQAWRSSYVALGHTTTVSSRLRVVQMRALYLDELERRAGPALEAWFRSGARAAGDPTRSLRIVTDAEDS